MAINQLEARNSFIEAVIYGSFRHEVTAQIKDVRVMLDDRTFDYLVSVQRRSDDARAVFRLPIVDGEGWDFELSEVDTAMLILFLQ